MCKNVFLFSAVIIIVAIGQSRGESSSKMVFLSNGDFPDSEIIVVMNADGTHQINIGDTMRMAELYRFFDQSWSPDRTRQAIVARKDGMLNIFLSNADSTDEVNLTNHHAWYGKLRWLPDGKKIAFVSDRHGNHDIYVMKDDRILVRRRLVRRQS